MINKEYDNLKILRTYIGGSKKKEFNHFMQVQYDESIGGECNWIEFRRIVIQYYEDVMHVMFSRKTIAKRISNIFMGLSITLMLFSLSNLSIIMLSLASISRILYGIFEHKRTKTLNSYNLSIDVIKKEINLLGFEM